MKTRLLILHPHQLICQSLATHLQSLDYDIHYCHTTQDNAMAIARQVVPDLVLADVHFDENQGFESARMIQRINRRTRIIIAVPPDSAYLQKALQTDANGYLPQRFELFELETCLQSVMDCFRYVSPVFTQLLSLPIPTTDPTTLAVLDALSVRRKQVLLLTCQGLKIKDIAVRLSMSPDTVVSNKKCIANVLGLSGRRDIVFFMASYSQWLTAHAHLVG